MKASESNGKPAPEPRRQYDETFKRHAVDLTLQGHRRVTQVAQELGVPETKLIVLTDIGASRQGPSTHSCF